QESLSAWLPRNAELTRRGDMNFNFITFLKPQRLDHDRGKTDGETVAPFCDLHHPLQDRHCAQCISTTEGGRELACMRRRNRLALPSPQGSRLRVRAGLVFAKLLLRYLSDRGLGQC